MAKGKVLVDNRRARHEYHLEEFYEAGIVLKGTEVKSIRQGKCSIAEAYCSIHGGEIFINGMHIAPYEQGNIHNMDPLRERKLLLHKREIMRIYQDVRGSGYTIIPLNVKLVRGKVKLDIALAKGKKLHDKRETKKKQDDQRRVERALRDHYR